MSSATHHVFFSYSRKDNAPNHEGWITAFCKRLKDQHRAYSGRELEVFFDREEIDDGSDWRVRLGQGLRTSKLFLAFLSPNYIKSPNCRWEFEEYLRREHTQARGDDGVATIYFELVPGMPGSELDPAAKGLEAQLRTDREVARWLDKITQEMGRRQLYTDRYGDQPSMDPRAAFDLRLWTTGGPRVLEELDAAERLEALRRDPVKDAEKLVTLADRLAELDRRIATRLDRCLLADLAPGLRSVGRSYPHFVGRHRELRDLHHALVADKWGWWPACMDWAGKERPRWRSSTPTLTPSFTRPAVGGSFRPRA